MARFSFIRVNLPLTIITPQGRKFRSIVQEVWEDSFAILALSAEETTLMTGSKVEVECYREDARYVFSVKIIEYMETLPPLYRLSYPEDYKRIQLRAHVRAKAALDFRYAIWPEEDWPQRPPMPQKRGVTVDISGGGLQMMLKEPVEVDDLLYIELFLPCGNKRMPLRVAGRVRRVIPRDIDGERMYEVGLAFKNITPRQEDQIVAFVFQQLIEERRQRS